MSLTLGEACWCVDPVYSGIGEVAGGVIKSSSSLYSSNSNQPLVPALASSLPSYPKLRVSKSVSDSVACNVDIKTSLPLNSVSKA